MNGPTLRIGLFGGSFDPVHTGHLLLARDAVEELGLDRLLLVPAGINPHRLDAGPRAPGAARLAMLRAAIEGEPRLEADPLELERPGPSYSIDTVETLQSRWPDAEIFLVLGEDNLPKLPEWHRFGELCQKVRFVCFGRRFEGELPPGLPPVHRLARRVDISSTEIRTRIAKRLPIRYLVPEAVHRFIVQHGLYLEKENPNEAQNENRTGSPSVPAPDTEKPLG
jgi:nicotinate-nucleotide adenylyltransferase